MNTTNPKDKTPFGVAIAVGIAVKMIKEANVAPSIVLANLFKLQHSETFPKNLDENYFSLNTYRTTDVEKKVISKIMDEMKKPNTNLKEILTVVYSHEWVKKVPEAPKPTFNHSNNQSYPSSKRQDFKPRTPRSN